MLVGMFRYDLIKSLDCLTWQREKNRLMVNQKLNEKEAEKLERCEGNKKKLQLVNS